MYNIHYGKATKTTFSATTKTSAPDLSLSSPPLLSDFSWNQDTWQPGPRVYVDWTERRASSAELFVRLRTAAFSHWLRNAELFVRHSCHMDPAGLRLAGMQLAWCLIGWATPTKNALFVEKQRFGPILAISGPSRPQKWIRLEILHRMVGPHVKLSLGSDFTTKNARKSTNTLENVIYFDKITFHVWTHNSRADIDNHLLLLKPPCY